MSSYKSNLFGKRDVRKSIDIDIKGWRVTFFGLEGLNRTRKGHKWKGTNGRFALKILIKLQ